MKRLILSILALMVILVSCNNGGGGSSLSGANIYRDATLQRIYNCRFTGSSSDLVKYISSELPEYRKAAAYTIGAMRDSLNMMSVMSLLGDDDSGVRLAAVNALGQIQHRAACEKLRALIAMDKNDEVRQAALVALGLCGGDDELNFVCSQHYLPAQPQMALAQMEALCMFLNNGLQKPQALAKAAEIIADRKADDHIKNVAAQFFAAYNDDLTPYTDILAQAYKNSSIVSLQTYIARAMRNCHTERSQYLLQRIITQDTIDYRIKIAAIESCSSFKYKDFKQEMVDLAYNADDRIASKAAEFILNKGVKADTLLYRQMSDNITCWKSRAIMRGAVLKYSNDIKALTDAIVEGIGVTSNICEREALTLALGSSIQGFRFVEWQILYSENRVTRMSALKALIYMFEQPGFDAASRKSVKEGNTSLYKEFYEIFRKTVVRGTPELAALAAATIADHFDKLQLFVGNTYYLNQALSKCSLPEDEKYYRMILAAIKTINGQDIEYKGENTFVMPDWNYIVNIEPDQKVKLKTTRGDVVLQLKVNQAPVAVQYFLKLVEAGYFNNTTLFYRSPDIIANDGSISEFEQTREVVIPCEPYFGTVSEGCVSLVPNTEMNVFSNKWFATLSPDVVSSFRSSVFASVVDGIDNLHAIQDGDMVISAEKL